jgi:prepilin-type N-terminal cleavage/methylation domain-containing protein
MKQAHTSHAANSRGFTLVEIMIVVMIIGVLLAIAIPNFVTARQSTRSKTCVANLKQIDSAKQQYIIDAKLQPTATPTSANIVPSYVRAFPSCPANGSYTIGDGNTNPTCSFSDPQYPHQLT